MTSSGTLGGSPKDTSTAGSGGQSYSAPAPRFYVRRQQGWARTAVCPSLSHAGPGVDAKAGTRGPVTQRGEGAGGLCGARGGVGRAGRSASAGGRR